LNSIFKSGYKQTYKRNPRKLLEEEIKIYKKQIELKVFNGTL
jgi:hypothetical protein